MKAGGWSGEEDMRFHLYCDQFVGSPSISVYTVEWGKEEFVLSWIEVKQLYCVLIWRECEPSVLHSWDAKHIAHGLVAIVVEVAEVYLYVVFVVLETNVAVGNIVVSHDVATVDEYFCYQRFVGGK